MSKFQTKLEEAGEPPTEQCSCYRGSSCKRGFPGLLLSEILGPKDGPAKKDMTGRVPKFA